MLRTKLFIALVIVSLTGLAVKAGEVVLVSTTYSKINASALDQPELYAVLYDPASGQMIMDANTPSQPALLECFVDTGASGIVISYMHATGMESVRNLGFKSSDYIGSYTETGIAGKEDGRVTRPLGVQVINTVPGQSQTIETENGFKAGVFNLWVRQRVGIGESVSTASLYGDPNELKELLKSLDIASGEVGSGLSDPINIIGMPVISQRVLVMDASSLSMDIAGLGGLLSGDLGGMENLSVGRMGTSLVTPAEADAIKTNVTFTLQMHDFIEDKSQPHPTFTKNPVFKRVTIKKNGKSDTTASGAIGWLFDTGAAGTMISFARAKAVGLIPSTCQSIADFMASYTGPTSEVGGIGEGKITIPLLELDEIRIPADEGFDMVWKNVTVSVVDVAGLDGVFGMNLLLPAITIDARKMEGILKSLENKNAPDDPMAALTALQSLTGLMTQLMDMSPGYFQKIVFDATGPDNVKLRLDCPLAARR